MTSSRKNKTLYIDKEAASALELVKCGLLKPLNGLMSKKEKQMDSKSNFLTTNIIKIFFDFVKHIIKDFEQSRSVSKIDKFSEEFSNLEHLVIQLDDKLQENRRMIETLKNQLLWEHLILFALIVTILIQILNG